MKRKNRSTFLQGIAPAVAVCLLPAFGPVTDFSYAGEIDKTEGRWLPWSEEEPSFRSRISQPRFFGDDIAERSGLAPGELEPLLSKLVDLAGIFRLAPVLNPPRGAEIMPARHILPRLPGEGPARACLWMVIWRPTRDEAGHFGGTIEVFVNEPHILGILQGEDKKGGIYLPYPSLEDVEGFPRYRTHARETAVLIAPGDRSPWRPVSQERWIRHLIDATHSRLDEVRENAVLTAERLKQFEERAKRERDIAAAVETGDHDALDALGRRDAAMMGRTIPRLEGELERLSPEQRTAPAYGLEFPAHEVWFPRREPQRPSLLLEAGDERARPLLAPNPDFFRDDIPATAFQSLVITERLGPFADKSQDWHDFMRDIRASLDWNVLAGMLR